MKHATEPLEVEVKFRLPADALPALDAHPALQAGLVGTHTQHNVTTYYDTPGWDLAQAGASFRVRRRGRQHIQTLKLRQANDGAFARGEWEWPVMSGQPDLDRLAETPLPPHLRGLDGVRPVFVTDVRRVLRTLQRDGATIELALDRGHVQAGDATEDIHELELELKAGDPSWLYRLAAELHAALPMALGAESKADRGWRLCTGRPRDAVKQADLDLPRDIAAGDAFRRIVAATLATLMANQPAAEAGAVEGVHQIRVAIRRLRAALVLFRPLLEPHAEARFTGELRRLGRVFGEARDWDVFCTETLAAAEQDGVASHWLALLRAPAASQRTAAHDRVTAELRGPAFTAVVLGLAAWADDTTVAVGDAAGTALAAIAPDLVGRRAHAVRRRGRHLDQRSDAALHALRKALKKLRYSVAFLAPLAPHKAVKQYLHGCKALQKHLGALNDAVTAVAMAERLGGDRQAELTPAVGALADWASARQVQARQRLQKDWRRFKATPLPF